MLINKQSNVVNSINMSAKKIKNIINTFVVTSISDHTTTNSVTITGSRNSSSEMKPNRNITTINSSSITNNNPCKLKSSIQTRRQQQRLHQKSFMSTSMSKSASSSTSASPLLQLQRNLLIGFILTILYVQVSFDQIIIKTQHTQHNSRDNLATDQTQTQLSPTI